MSTVTPTNGIGPYASEAATIRVESIPGELRAVNQWVCWRFETRDGKRTKVPINALTGRRASSTEPSDWTPFDVAMDALNRLEDLDGVGLVVSYADPYVGIDLDGAFDENGEVEEWALPAVALNSYTEVTPSGRGLRVWVKGKLPDGKRSKTIGPGRKVEMYESGRYFTITGDHWPVSPSTIEDRSAELIDLHRQTFAPAHKAEPRKVKLPPLALDDEDLLSKARAARNGVKFVSLYDHGDLSGCGGDDSAADFALVGLLAYWTGPDPARIERLFGRSALGTREKWTGREDYRARTIAAALDGRTEFYSPGRNGHARRNGKAPDPAPKVETFPPGAPDPDQGTAERPVVEVSKEMHKVLGAALATLPRDPTLYHRSQRLVTVVEDTRTRIKITRKSSVRQQEKSPRILELSAALVGPALTRNGDWFQWKKDPEGEFVAVGCLPPDWAIKAVASSGHYPRVRHLRSIAAAPFIRPDGSIVETPGYDADTETLYVPSGEFPPVPTHPTRADARESARLLFGLVEQFPFVDDDHKAVWLATLLSVIARPAIDGPCPGTAFDANVPATGKTLLASIVGIITSGREVATIGYPKDPAEMGKIITSVALAGYSVVLLDNVPTGSNFGCDQLDRVLTSTSVDGRELGKSRMVGQLDVSAVWIVTGNNISPTADAFRRWLPCRIESLIERPDRRDDLVIPDLPEHVRERRGELVAAALTILKAHADAGWPDAGWAPLGSYTSWDRIVRGAVWFATGLDCCKTQDLATKDDPERAERLALAMAWLDLKGGRTGVTVAEARKQVLENPARLEVLHSLFQEWGFKGEIASSVKIGNRIKAIKDRNINGLTFKEAGKSHQAILWKVAGEVGEEGEDHSQTSRPRLDSHNSVNVCGENPKSGRQSPDEPPPTSQPPLDPGEEVAEWAR